MSETTGTFETPRPGFVVVQSDGVAHEFGTYMFNSEFGEVTKFDIGRLADEVSVTGGMGQVIFYILKNFRYEITVEIIQDKAAKLPGPGDLIEFPVAGIKGRVKGDVKITADDSNAHKISLTASSWDSLDNGGAGTLTVVDPTAAQQPNS